MTNHGDHSPEAKQAALGKAKAAGVFAEHAEHIVAALPEVPDDHVLVAVVSVNAGTHEFSGTHHVAQDEIVERVPALEGDTGWAMVFTPGNDADEIRRRADEMATLARRRAEMITRISARKNS